MILNDLYLYLRVHGYPRVSGGDPDFPLPGVPEYKLSPRERG